MMLKMQQESTGSWRYEWPLKKKVKWLVQQLVSKRQRQVLRRWLRQDEGLSDTEEMVCICEPEDGENLSEEEERSVEDLVDFQEGRDELSDFQVGNKKRSVEDLIDFQEGRSESSDFQVGKVKKMRLSESLVNSEESSDQQGVLTEMEMRLSESLRNSEQ
jgi:hypothetical protein